MHLGGWQHGPVADTNQTLSKVIGNRVITVVLADEQEVARIGIEHILGSHPNIKLVASVNQIAEFDFTETVDIVILGSADTDGIAYDLAALPARCATVIICAPADSVNAVTAALRSGAVGMITRMTSPEELLFTIDAVHRGGCYISSELAETMSAGAGEDARYGEKPVLAPRELETAMLIAQGLTHRQISKRMGLTEATVSTYVKRIRAKLKAGNKADLTKKVIELGYLPLGDR